MQSITCPKCKKTFPPGTTSCPDDQTSLSETTAAAFDSKELPEYPLANTTPSSESVPAASPKTATTDGSGFGPGVKIGEYIVEEKLGEGGMGQVWRGRHPHIGKRVAIKILSDRLSKDHKTLARFMNEAKAVNEIQHRNIVDIFSFGELPDGRPYFVMELLRGKSLSAYLKERGVLKLSEIQVILEQVCRALQAAHDQEIVHRDLKPDNIFLVIEEGAPLFVKLLDFGIAKLSDKEALGPDGHRLTATGTVMGTAAYMSPEQAEGAKATDSRTDIYALGIILFELLTGRTPFYEPGDGVGSIISKHMYLPAPSPSAMVSGRNIPPGVEALVLKMLSKKPSERPARCIDVYTEFVKAIGEGKPEDTSEIQGAKPIFSGKASQDIANEVVKHTPNPQTRPGDYYTGASSERPAAGSKPLFWVASLALLLVAGVSFYFLTNSGQSPTPPKAAVSLPPKEEPKSEPVSAPVKPASTQSTPPAPKIEMVSLIVYVEQGEAKVLLDGVEKGTASNKAPLKLDIPKGDQTLMVSVVKEGFDTVTQPFLPAATETLRVKLQKTTTTPIKKPGNPVKKPGFNEELPPTIIKN